MMTRLLEKPFRKDTVVGSPATGDGGMSPPASPPVSAAKDDRRQQRRPRAGTRALLAIIAAVIAVAGGWALLSRTLPSVRAAHPARHRVLETIAASGQVVGHRESVVGASAVSGVVASLAVEVGDRVARGQILARIEDRVARAQVEQAERAWRAALAVLAQTARPPLSSERDAAHARVRQARAAVDEAAAAVARAVAAAAQTSAAREQAKAQQAQAEAASSEAAARARLAGITAERYRALLAEGAIARQSADQAEADWETAAAALTAARRQSDAARAAVAAGAAADAAARQDIAAAKARRYAAGEALATARADAATSLARPRPEDVEVARRQAHEAEAALRVAREQERSTVVRAPFAGTVTAILTEVGGAVGPGSALLRLAETGLPEVMVNVDENDLPGLQVGQRATITSPAYAGVRIPGRVTRLGAAVDSSRGTVAVTVIPQTPPAWLRPGQTLDVNLIVSEARERLTVPVTAVRREGDRTEVFVVRGGRAAAVVVTVGDAAGGSVPVMSGISGDDLVIQDAARVRSGARVRIAARER